MKAEAVVIDVTGERCPVPLVKARAGLNKLRENEIAVITGDGLESEKEIILAVKEMGMELVGLENEANDRWRLLIRRR